MSEKVCIVELNCAEWWNCYSRDAVVVSERGERGGRSDEMIKIPIKKEKSNHAFTLYKKEWGILFGIGLPHDICIMKETKAFQ